MREGRTHALGMVLGAGRVVSFCGDVFARQCESLTTRFLGATALCTSSSSSFFSGFASSGRSGLRSVDLLSAWAGFQFGLSVILGVVGCDLGFDLGATGLGSASRSTPSPPSSAPAMAASAPPSCCQRLILSRTLAGLLMPMAFAKSLPFMPSPFFLLDDAFFFGLAASSAAAGMGKAPGGHWRCRRSCRVQGGAWQVQVQVQVFVQVLVFVFAGQSIRQSVSQSRLEGGLAGSWTSPRLGLSQRGR
jgi:hypothetical protein